MAECNPTVPVPQWLREAAEEMVRDGELSVEINNDTDSRTLMHELSVYYAELRIQNDELRDAQHRLEQSRHCYYQLFDAAPVGYLVVARDGHVLQANHSAEMILLTDRHMFVHKPLVHWVVDSDRSAWIQFLKKAFDTGSAHVRLRVTVSDDAERVLAFSGQKMMLVGYDAPVCLITMSDMTIQRQVEQELAHYRDALEQVVNQRTARLDHANRRLRRLVREYKQTVTELRDRENLLAHMSRVSTLGEMASVIAHEVNQPLTAITNYARGAQRMLDNGRAAHEKMAFAFEQIGQQAIRAGEIIRHVRSMLRKQPIKSESVNVLELVRETIALANMEAKTLAIRFVLKCEDEALVVQGHRIQLIQVILNLLRNAMDAMSDPQCAPRLISIGLRGEDRQVLITVADHGPGIDADQLETIFEPFHSSKEAGLGMGLAISRTIIEQHNGQLTAGPGPGQGAEFTIRLPLQG